MKRMIETEERNAAVDNNVDIRVRATYLAHNYSENWIRWKELVMLSDVNTEKVLWLC